MASQSVSVLDSLLQNSLSCHNYSTKINILGTKHDMYLNILVCERGKITTEKIKLYFTENVYVNDVTNYALTRFLVFGVSPGQS